MYIIHTYACTLTGTDTRLFLRSTTTSKQTEIDDQTWHVIVQAVCVYQDTTKRCQK